MNLLTKNPDELLGIKLPDHKNEIFRFWFPTVKYLLEKFSVEERLSILTWLNYVLSDYEELAANDLSQAREYGQSITSIVSSPLLYQRPQIDKNTQRSTLLILSALFVRHASNIEDSDDFASSEKLVEACLYEFIESVTLAKLSNVDSWHAAQNSMERHSPLTKIKERFSQLHREGKHKSASEAARSFWRALTDDEKELLAAKKSTKKKDPDGNPLVLTEEDRVENAVRTLTRHLRKEK